MLGAQMKYRPCNGGCTKKGTHCDGCGRTHEEVETLNGMVKELAVYAKEMQYDNIEDYANSVATGIYYKLDALNKSE
jgi:hypothetical protein